MSLLADDESYGLYTSSFTLPGGRWISRKLPETPRRTLMKLSFTRIC